MNTLLTKLKEDGYQPVDPESILPDDRVTTLIHEGVRENDTFYQMIERVISQAKEIGFDITKEFGLLMDKGKIDGAYNFVFIQHKDNVPEELVKKGLSMKAYTQKKLVELMEIYKKGEQNGKVK